MIFTEYRVSSRVLKETRSMTKEERVEEVIGVEDALEGLAEAEGILSAKTVEHLETTQETAQTLPPHVSTVNPLSILLKNVLFCYLRCRKK